MGLSDNPCQNGTVINKNKFQFCQDSIEFAGWIQMGFHGLQK